MWIILANTSSQVDMLPKWDCIRDIDHVGCPGAVLDPDTP